MSNTATKTKSRGARAGAKVAAKHIRAMDRCARDAERLATNLRAEHRDLVAANAAERMSKLAQFVSVDDV